MAGDVERTAPRYPHRFEGQHRHRRQSSRPRADMVSRWTRICFYTSLNRRPFLWPFHVKGIDFPRTDIPREQRRVVWAKAEPSDKCSHSHPSHTLYVNDVFDFTIAQPKAGDGLDTAITLFPKMSKIYVLSVARPCRVDHLRAKCLRPLLCRHIIQHQFSRNSGRSSNEFTVRRPLRAKESIGTRHGRDAL